MNKARKSLIVSIAVLVVAVVVATSATFAWFAMTDTPTVDDFDLTVTSQDGLYVSAVAASGYGMTLKASDLKAQADFAASTMKLDALTPALSTGAIGNTIALKDFNGNTAATGSYYQFTVYFLSTAAYTVYLDDASNITNKTDSTKKSFAPVDVSDTIMKLVTGSEEAIAISKGAAIDAKAANAARLGLSTTAKSLVYNMNKGKGWDNYTDSNMAHSIYESMGGTLSADNKAAEGTDVKTAITANASVTAADAVLTLTATTEGQDGYNYFQDGSTTYTGSITVTIWLEGKDPDCFASIYEDVMTVALGFYGKAVA